MSAENTSNSEITLDDLISGITTYLENLKTYKKQQRTIVRGWAISHSRGYYRAQRRIGGKPRCVCLGASLDLPQAERKIEDWELRHPDLFLGGNGGEVAL